MTSTPRRLDEVPTVHSSEAEVWYLKPVVYNNKQVQIITQNFNGPCSFIAICNTLILRGNIKILPPDRTTVSYEHLSQLVAEYLLIHSPGIDISDTLSIMPFTQKGLDLNPVFDSPTAFHPATETAGAELKLFAQVGIHLVHGWLVHPESEEAYALREEGIRDYDSAVAFIAEADFLGGGVVVGGEGTGAMTNLKRDWTNEERRKIKNALTIRHFLQSTWSQLTYHGLFHLASELPQGSLVALFRSSHLAVLLKEGVRPTVHSESSRLPGIVHQEPGASSTSLQKNVPTASLQVDNTQLLLASNSESGPALTTHSDQLYHRDDQQQAGAGTADTQTPSEQTTTPPILELSNLSLDPPKDPASHQDSNLKNSAMLRQSGSSSQKIPSSSSLTPAHPTPPQRHPRAQTPQQQVALHTLVTDQVFLHEPSVVWERLEDVEGAAGEFVDSDFIRSSPAGGDWAGQTAEQAIEVANGGDWTDLELAQRLQAEEEERFARREHERYLQQQQEIDGLRSQKELERRRASAQKKDKKKDCIIM